MSQLDQRAIEQVAQLARLASTPSETGLFMPSVFAPKGQVEIIGTEKYCKGRARFRGAMNTPFLPDFCDYVKMRNIATTRVFADINGESATAFFNIGTDSDPGHCDDTAKLSLGKTPEYAALLRANEARYSQRELANWIEDWAANLSPVGSPSIAASITAIRSIEIKAGATYSHEDGDFGATKTALEQIEAKAKSSDLVLPTGFIFLAIPYDGFVERAFQLRLSVITGDKPVLSLRVVGMGQAQQQIGEEFAALLGSGIGESASIYRGSFTP